MLEQIDWEEISKMALLGTDRRSFSPELLEQAQALGIDTEEEPAKILIHLVLAGNMLLKSSRQLPRAKKANRPLSLESALQPCPPHMAQLLPRIIKENWEEILQEYAIVLADRGWRFPSQFLPALLNKAAREPAFWQQIKSIILQQAEGLIALNPNWRDLLSTSSSNPQQFTPAAFATERQVDVKLANERLAAAWPALKKVSKLQYLAMLGQKIQLADEKLLLSFWPEKNSAVAQKIFDLLLTIPKSKTEKIRSKYFPKLVGPKNKIELPDLTSAEKEDLKLIAMHTEFKGGLKANLLTQLLSGTSWSVWEKNLSLTPDKLGRWLKQQEWSAEILTSLFFICEREQNENLRFAIFKYLTSLKAEIPEVSHQLFQGMSVLEFQKLSKWSFEQGPSIFDAEGIYINMALQYVQSWPNEITFGFFKLVKSWLHKNPRYWEGWYIWQIIRRIALYADARQAPLLERAFQQDTVWLLAEEEIGKFMTILKFREKLYLD